MNTSMIRRTRRSVARVLFALSVLGISAAPRAAIAQDATPPSAHWEFLASSGAVVTTGAHRDALSNGALSTLQLSFVPAPPLAFTGTLGWARNRERVSGSGMKLDLFTYDLGLESRLRTLQGPGRTTVVPFVSVGTGARTYRHRDSGPAAVHALTAFAGAGAEIGSARVRVRLEARDYLLDSEPLTRGADDRFVSEWTLLAGLRLVSR